MALKHISTVFVIIFVIFSFGESRNVETNERGFDYAPFLAGPAKNAILDFILQNQGTSSDQIQDAVISADGNLEHAVRGINSAFRESVLKIEDDAVRINPDALRNIVRNSFQAAIHNKISYNPDLASTLEKNVHSQINAESPQFNAAIKKGAVPLDVAQRSLVVTRKKRSLEPKAFDLQSIATDIITGILRDQFGSIISGITTNVKELLTGLLVLVAPGDPAGDFAANLVNWAVKALLQIVTAIEQTFVPASNEVVQSRRKRDLIGDIVDGIVSGDDPTSIIDDITSGGNNVGLLDGIVGPILTLLGNVLTPVNTLIKGLVQQIANQLEPVLGSIIVTKLLDVVNALVDLIIPANPV